LIIVMLVIRIPFPQVKLFLMTRDLLVQQGVDLGANLSAKVKAGTKYAKIIVMGPE
jgi:hypothetical protein